MPTKPKHYLITGASSGLGKELARQLAKDGQRLSLVARRETSLKEFHKELGSPESVLVLKADVTRYEELQAAVAKAEEILGGIDVLIANAGVAHHIRSESMDISLAKEMVETNFMGVIHAVGAIAPYFIKRKIGHIVGVSSLTSYFPSKRYSIYGATKTGVSAYLEALRLEMEPQGVTVTTICPGFIKTPMTEDNRFAMPFLLDVEDAARKIITAIDRRVDHSNFPQIVYRSIQALKLLPKPLFTRAMRTLRF